MRDLAVTIVVRMRVLVLVRVLMVGTMVFNLVVLVVIVRSVRV